jgi:hypothetical protein
VVGLTGNSAKKNRSLPGFQLSFSSSRHHHHHHPSQPQPQPPTMSPEKTNPPPDSAAALLDEDYDSAEDSDFDPTTAPAAGDDAESDDSSSESDSEAEAKPKRKRKRADSFDIPPDDVPVEPLIKTRSQRAAEQREKSGGVATGKVTTDVDALWAAMNSPAPPRTPASEEKKEQKEQKVEEKKTETENETGERMVTIKHTYEFAGETITEEKVVPASSETARVYFSSSASASPAPSAPEDGKPARRPPPKKRASAFDAAAAARSKTTAQPAKINTLEKSRLDWAGFVDKEGIGDDLKKWNKGDKGYLDRQAFLGRVEENKDRQLKEARSRK